jgi:hypothetical protein
VAARLGEPSADAPPAGGAGAAAALAALGAHPTLAGRGPG